MLRCSIGLKPCWNGWRSLENSLTPSCGSRSKRTSCSLGQLRRGVPLQMAPRALNPSDLEQSTESRRVVSPERSDKAATEQNSSEISTQNLETARRINSPFCLQDVARCRAGTPSVLAWKSLLLELNCRSEERSCSRAVVGGSAWVASSRLGRL